MLIRTHLLAAVSPAVVLSAMLLMVPGAFAQISAARVMSVTGSVKAVDTQGRERPLEKGAEVRSGDKIITADGALVQMRLNDGGYLSVRSGTEMVIDRFVYDEKNTGNSNFLVSLVRGGFRSITGLIGKTNPDAYQIRTGTATVGIRGTDHEPMVIPEGVPGMATLGAPGIYDKVNEGETFIRNKGGVLSLKRGDVGFAPVLPERPPQILQKIPDFYKVEVKTDARDAKDASSEGSRKTIDTGGLLRPSLAARKDALKTLDSPVLDNPALRTSTPSIVDPVAAPLSPVLTDTSRVLSPATTTLQATTTLIAPIADTAPVTSTLIAPVTTTVVPITATLTPVTATLIAPVTATAITPVTTTVSPVITTITPVTTVIVPKASTLLLK